MPKPRTPSATREEEHPDAFVTSDKIPKPQYAGNPNDLPEFALKLAEYLETQDSRYITLVESGYVLSRGKVCFASANHIDRYCNGLLPTGSFSKPTVVDPSDYTALPPSATISSAASSTPSSAAAAGGSATPSPSASLMPPPSNHEVNDEKRAEVSRELGQEILSCLATKSLRDAWKKKYGTSGIALLVGYIERGGDPDIICTMNTVHKSST